MARFTPAATVEREQDRIRVRINAASVTGFSELERGRVEPLEVNPSTHAKRATRNPARLNFGRGVRAGAVLGRSDRS